jgi:hypothetical protein
MRSLMRAGRRVSTNLRTGSARSATRAANNGATVAQLNAIFGWTGSKQASHYTQNADRKRLAREAISKLVNETGTSIHAPKQKVRVSAPKEK